MSFIKTINKKEDTIQLELYNGEDIQVLNDIELDPVDKNSNTMKNKISKINTIQS